MARKVIPFKGGKKRKKRPSKKHGGGALSGKREPLKHPGPAPSPTTDSPVYVTTSSTGGRPQIELTTEGWDLVDRMASAMCTVEEIAERLGISRKTLAQAPQLKERFDQSFRMKRAHTKLEVRERQLALAKENGHPAHQIWWGKQHLDQKDKQEHSGSAAMNAFEQVAGADERLLQVLDKLITLRGR